MWNVTMAFGSHIKNIQWCSAEYSNEHAYCSSRNKTWVHFWIQPGSRAIWCNLWTVAEVLYSSLNEKSSVNSCFSPETIGMRPQNWMPNATPSSVLSWHETVINQNSEQQLALCWHSVCVQQLKEEVSQMMNNTFHCLAKCICYHQHWKSSTCYVSL